MTPDSRPKTNFKVPDNYFDELPDKIMDQINSIPDFEKENIINPFSVPENYFEKLPVAVSERVSSAKSKGFSWTGIFTRPRYVIPLACILLAAGLYFFSKSNHNNYKEQEITMEELQNSTYFQSIDEDLFVDMLDQQSGTETNDSLAQYLIDNNIELSDIENAL